MLEATGSGMNKSRDDVHGTEHRRNIQTVKHTFETIPRSREVGQSYVTSVFTTLYSLTMYSFSVVYKHKPDFILVNGPGVCVPICFWSFVLRIFSLSSTRITFVESFCRVKSLSLTGKILYYFVDDFIVQHEELKMKYPRSTYLGALVQFIYWISNYLLDF